MSTLEVQVIQARSGQTANTMFRNVNNGNPFLNANSSTVTIGHSTIDVNMTSQNAVISTIEGTGAGTLLTIAANTVPSANNTYDLGTANNVWRNVYTGDLMLSNLGRDSGNDVDGSRGSWVLQEGDSNLYVINKVTGKKFRLAMEEVD